MVKRFHAPLAQLVEQIPLKDKVEGSIPSGRTSFQKVSLRKILKLGRDGAMFC